MTAPAPYAKNCKKEVLHMKFLKKLAQAIIDQVLMNGISD